MPSILGNFKAQAARRLSLWAEGYSCAVWGAAHLAGMEEDRGDIVHMTSQSVDLPSFGVCTSKNTTTKVSTGSACHHKQKLVNGC